MNCCLQIVEACGWDERKAPFITANYFLYWLFAKREVRDLYASSPALSDTAEKGPVFENDWELYLKVSEKLCQKYTSHHDVTVSKWRCIHSKLQTIGGFVRRPKRRHYVSCTVVDRTRRHFLSCIVVPQIISQRSQRYVTKCNSTSRAQLLKSFYEMFKLKHAMTWCLTGARKKT